MNTAPKIPWGDDAPTDQIIAERREARTRVGAAVVAWGDAVDQVEALYAESEGEVTDETMCAEAWKEMAERDAAEALARFERFCVLTVESMDTEIDRLKASKERMRSRIDWCRAKLLELLGDRKSLAVGPYRITSRASSSVQADEDIDLESLAKTHPDCVRWSEPVPAKPALDKAAVKVALTSDAIPPSGVRVVTTRKASVR